MRISKALTILLAIVMLVALLPITAMAEEDVLSSPDRYEDVSMEDAIAYLDGSGTAEDPFQIWNEEDLYYINYIEYWRSQDPDVYDVFYYQQMTDLDLSAAGQFQQPTGYITANFGGVYDGGGYTISGMEKSLFYFTKGEYIGDEDGTVFIDYVSGDSHDRVFSAVVRNLIIDEPYISQTVATDVIEQLGAVAAYAVNTAFYNVQVLGGEINGVSGAAAIAGRAGSVVIDNCYADSDIYASMHRAAGIVSNLRIVDAKKGAIATSLVINCAFAGNISGNLDGERGSAGIVGAVYMDGEPEINGGSGLPLYIIGCTFSGSISGTVTSSSGNFGGILGTSYLGPGLYLQGNTVTGDLSDISVEANATAANVGGLVGKMLNYSLLGEDIVLVMEDNDAEQATLPKHAPLDQIYVGSQIGCLNDVNRAVEGPISLSNEDGLGIYGNIQGAQLTGDVGDLVLPQSSNDITLYILPGATINMIKAQSGKTLNIYNEGQIDDIQNDGNINLYANSGTIGNVTSTGGCINVGYPGKTADNYPGKTGNEGSVGNLNAYTYINIYRNAEKAQIGNITATTGYINIGQGNNATAGVAEYNVNAGSTGSVNAATTVGIYSTAAGNVATGENQSVTAGTSVAIGSATCANANNIGPITAQTTVTVYNGAGEIGDIQAISSVTIYGNAGEIGNVTSETSSIAVGGSGKTSDSTAAGQVGNSGHIGNLTACTNAYVYRNTATGTIGDITTDTGSVTIGQGNNGTEAVRSYNVNAGSIGSVNAATTVNIYSTTAGNVATGEGQSVVAGTTVAIGSATYPNYNTVGNVTAKTSVSGYTLAPVGTITAPSNSLVNGMGDERTVITANGNITLTADASGTITADGKTYDSGAKLVLTATGTVTFAGGNPVTLSSIQASNLLTLIDENGLALISGPVTAAGEIKIGVASPGFAGTINGPVTSSKNITIGANNTSNFSGMINDNITAGNALTIYNGGTIGGAENSAARGNITISNLANGSITGAIRNTSSGNYATSITNNGAPMAGCIQHLGDGALTLSGNRGENINSLYTGEIEVARALTIGGHISANNQQYTIQVRFTGTTAIISSGNHDYYLTATGDNLTSVSVATTATTANKNTLDLHSMPQTATVSQAIGTGTTLIPPDNVTASGLGQLVSGTISDTISGNAYANGSITINEGVALSANGVLTITSKDATITNYGTIGEINHIGSGTLTIYNIGKQATIGNVTSAGSITVGASAKTANNNGNGVQVGNEGQLGNLTAYTNINVYRNAENGQIGDIIAKTGSVTIGQGNNGTEAVRSYNVNAGIIGSVDAATTVSIHSTAQGSVATGENQSVNADTSVTIGSANGANANDIGPITAQTTVTVYNGAGEIGDIEAISSVTIYGNGEDGVIGNVTSTTSSIGVGGGSKTSDETAAGQVGNSGHIGSLDAYTNAYVYRNTATGTIGDITTDTGSVTIGQGNNGTEAVRSYNVNAGSIGSVNAATTVGIYSTAAGNVATGENQSVTAGTSVTIGAANCGNANTVGNVQAGSSVTIINAEAGSVATGENQSVEAGTSVTIGAAAYANNGHVGPITAQTTVTVYNGAGEIGDIEAESSVAIYGNAGEIGNVTSETSSIAVGGGSKTSDETAAGQVGNSGHIGNLNAYTNINIYRNTATGTIGNITAETSTITIGQGNNASPDVAAYNVNAGSIGSVDAATTVGIYSTAAGNVATGENQSVNAGGSVTIGAANCANANHIGPVYANGTSASSLYAGSGQVANLHAAAGVKVYVADNCADVNVSSTYGDITIEDQSITSNPNVNVTTDGGDVRISRAEGNDQPVSAKVNLTVTEELTAGQTIFIRGAFASLRHQGAGDVIMESADTSVTNVLLEGTGQLKEFGSTGAIVVPPSGTKQDYYLSLVAVDVNRLEVYLMASGGNQLPAGSFSGTAENGTFSPASGTVSGGGATEKIGEITVNAAQSGDVAVSLTVQFTPADETTATPLNANRTVHIPAIVERVDVLLLTNEADFQAAAQKYSWQNTSQPANYPVLAVMPVTDTAYTGVTVKVNDTAVNDDGCVLLPVDKDQILADGKVTTQVTATAAGAPAYEQAIDYILTAADKAKLDTENQYYYLVFRYMDGKTEDMTVPVKQGESLNLPAAADRTGYQFLGWDSGDGSLHTANTPFTPSENVTFTAKWSATSQTYALYYDVVGGGSVLRLADGRAYPLASGTYFRKGETVTLTPQRNAGFIFVCWIVDGIWIYDQTLDVTMDEDISITAVFSYGSGSGSHGGSSSDSAIQNYKISIGSTENGDIDCDQRAKAGDKVTITVTPDTGYQLDNLEVITASGDSLSLRQLNEKEYTFTMPEEAVRIIAAFAPAEEPAWVNPFIDVQLGDWYYDAVAYAYTHELMAGTSNSSFSPNLATTRGMIVTILYRLEGQPQAQAASFSDVAQGMYYADAVAWANANQIVTGYGDGRFGPADSITREQLAAILYRYAAYKKYDTSQSAAISGFSDTANISDYAVEPMAWAIEQGLITGMGDGTINPQGEATRAQVAAIFMRFLEN